MHATGLLLLLSTATAAPIDTTSYVVLNHGRPAGEMLVAASADSIVVKYHHVDRNRGPRSEAHYLLRQGRVVGGRTWDIPLTATDPVLGEPSDRFDVRGDSVFWQGGDGDSLHRAGYSPASIYGLFSFTPYDQALLARFLLSQREHFARLLPQGSARLTVVGETSVRTSQGRQRVRLAMMRDSTGEASGVWLDDRDQLFADQVGWFITVRRGAEAALPALRAIEMRYRDSNAITLGRRLAPPIASAIAIVGGDLFDSERGVMLPRRTVVIRGDRIGIGIPIGVAEVWRGSARRATSPRAVWGGVRPSAAVAATRLANTQLGAIRKELGDTTKLAPGIRATLDTLSKQVAPLKKKFLILDEGEELEFSAGLFRSVLTFKLGGLSGGLSGFLTGASTQDLQALGELRTEVPAAIGETNALVARLTAFVKQLAEAGLYPAVPKPVK